MNSLDEKLHISETCHPSKIEFLCQAVCSKMALDPVPSGFKNFKEIRESSSLQKKKLKK